MHTVTARAPGRVNLIGDHTDYNGGLCLPIAIDLATTATVSLREDVVDRVVSDQFPTDEGGRPGRGWRRYVAGTLAELRELGWPVPGLDIGLTTRLPLGGGLSSSAALECAVATAVAGLLDHPLDDALRHVLAGAARRAETDHVGAPTGGMDQLASMFGRADHALLLDFSDSRDPARTVPGPSAPTVTPVPCRAQAAGYRLLVTDTRVRHRLADDDGGYTQRRRECENGDPRRWAHVHSENERVRAAVTALAAERWEEVGALMTASHVSLRDDFESSCRELDLTVDAAIAHGAAGARVTGGGFGGCTITLTQQDRVDAVRDGIDAAYDAARLPRPTHHEVVPAEGARVTSAQRSTGPTGAER